MNLRADLLALWARIDRREGAPFAECEQVARRVANLRPVHAADVPYCVEVRDLAERLGAAPNGPCFMRGSVEPASLAGAAAQAFARAAGSMNLRPMRS